MSISVCPHINYLILSGRTALKHRLDKKNAILNKTAFSNELNKKGFITFVCQLLPNL